MTENSFMKTRVGILGLGGVGGYYGGKLAHHFYGNEEVEIVFIARGKHLDAIRENGLKIIEGENEMIVRPNAISVDTATLGKFDVLLVAVKTYSLEEAIQSVKSNVTPETIILPLVNGIEPYEMLVREFSNATVFQGCCYLNAFIESPGVVKFRGGFEQVLFGFPNEIKRNSIAELFSSAGINYFCDADISKQIWEKFIFGSTVSSIGSLQNESFGEISANQERVNLLRNLINECLSVANAKGIIFENDFEEKLVKKVASYPYEARTSMQLDFATGKQTEVETFTGYVVRCGEELGIDLPFYKSVYRQLKEKPRA